MRLFLRDYVALCAARDPSARRGAMIFLAFPVKKESINLFI